MSKDLIRGFLLAHNAPAEILNALVILPDIAAQEPCVNLDENMDLWPMSVRTTNCLYAAGIRTKKQLLSLSECEILKITNFGRKSLNELRELIKPLQFADYDKSIKLVRDGYHYFYPKSMEAA